MGEWLSENRNRQRQSQNRKSKIQNRKSQGGSMALTGALFSGVSGITTNGNAMNIIGDNIANANTVGFKSSRGVFFDLLSADVGGTRIGLASRLASSDRLFVQGGVETT